MKIKMSRFIGLFLCFIMLVGLLPLTSFAENATNRIVISVVRGSALIDNYPPACGKKAVGPSIMVFEGIPAYFNSGSNCGWYKKNSDSTATKLQKTDTFLNGTYYFRCQVRIDGAYGKTHVLNEDGITANVNGKNWTIDSPVTIEDNLSYVWVKSPEFVLENTKMTFDQNGGDGTQEPVYANEYDAVIMPECTFTKTGDKFFAWNVGDGLYFPGDSYIISENTTATAVWKSEITANIDIRMTTISDGKKTSDITFSYDTAKYSVSANWYEGDEVDKFKIIDDNTALSSDKNYTVQLTINSTKFLAETEDLNITLNGEKMKNILIRKSKQVVINVQILNNVSVEFFEPMDEVPLAISDEIKPNSDRFYVSSAGWFGRLNALPGEQITDGTLAKLGKKYYLSLILKNAAENQIFGGETVKVNGKEYEADRDIKANEDSVSLILEFTATYPQIRISEDSDGYIIVESPKDMEVTFAAALYNSAGKMTDVVLKPNYAVKTGSKKIAPNDILGIDKFMSFLFGTRNYKVKFMVFKDITGMSPLCPALIYKHRFE